MTLGPRGRNVVLAASMRPGRFHPGNREKRLFEEFVKLASMRPGRFHPGNSPCGTPCATWAFHPFCERWLLCRPGQANGSPNAHHNTTYLLVIQHRKHPARATGPFSSTRALAGTRQTCSEKAECLAKQWSPAGSAPYRSCPDFRPEDRLGPPAPSPRLGCDPPPT